MANFCGKCGTRLDPVTGQCPKCHPEVKVGTAAPQPAIEKKAAVNEDRPVVHRADRKKVEPEKKKSKAWWIVLLCAAVVFFVGILVVGVILLGVWIYNNVAEAPTWPTEEVIEVDPSYDISEEAILQTVEPMPTIAIAEPTEEPMEMTACLSCDRQIPLEEQYCYYCGWDQLVDPNATPEPITAHVGSNEGLAVESRKLAVTGAYESTVVEQAGKHNNTATATVDGNLETSWQEGVDGYGVGEWLRYDLGGECNVTGISLWLGNWRTYDWYVKNGVPKALTIQVGSETFTVDFPYGQEQQWVVFSAPIPADEITIMIEDYYAGSQYDDTCIAEVAVYGWQ